MNCKSLLLFLLLISTAVRASAQISGCTDPQALNFEPLAIVNDGSCIYPPTSTVPIKMVRSLPLELRETSGLIFWNNALWTHNDSGGEPVIYKFDTLTGKVLQRVTLVNARNIDWEEIAQDDTCIYIGDFGNNLGNRKDLKIYIVSKTDIPYNKDGEVTASVINFSYADQQNFDPANRSNDYDCEAMVAYGDSLYLFTKNWANQQSRLYALPKAPGTYSVFPGDTLAADGLITGADLSPSGNELVLCGYKNYSPILWLLFDFRNGSYFKGNKRLIKFSGMTGTQTEGAAFLRESEVVISSEKTTVSPAGLFKINISPWTKSD
jgi:hypothetical protein